MEKRKYIATMGDFLTENKDKNDIDIKLGDTIIRGKVDSKGTALGETRKYRVIGLNPNLKIHEVHLIDGEEELGEIEEFGWDITKSLAPIRPGNEAMSHVWIGDF